MDYGLRTTDFYDDLCNVGLGAPPLAMGRCARGNCHVDHGRGGICESLLGLLALVLRLGLGQYYSRTEKAGIVIHRGAVDRAYRLRRGRRLYVSRQDAGGPKR